MAGKPKSGKVTINLGPREVRQILEDARFYGISELRRTVAGKVIGAVKAKFSLVQADMDEIDQARKICYGMRESDEWKELGAGFKVRSDALYEQLRNVDAEQWQTMERLIQEAFDKAGITKYKACNYGYIRVSDGKEDWEL